MDFKSLFILFFQFMKFIISNISNYFILKFLSRDKNKLCGFRFKISHLITILKCCIWNKLLSKGLNLERRKNRDKKTEQFFIKRFGKKIWGKWQVKSNEAFATF